MAHGGYRPEDGIHVLQAYEYADSTARTSASGFRSVDVGKVARQQSDGSFWILTDESPITWLQLVAGTSGITALSGDATATGPGAVTITVTGLQSEPISATTPSEGDVLTFLSGVWTPSAPSGGGGGDLQDAYDLGPNITQGLDGIDIIQGSGSPTDNFMLRLRANLSSGSPVYALLVERDPGTSGATGGVATFFGGANLDSDAVTIQHAGAGDALVVATSGAGAAAIFDTQGGTGSGVNILAAPGTNPLQVQIDGDNALTIDGTLNIVDVGDSAAPLTVITYGVVRSGSGVGTDIKSFEAYTTNTGSDPLDVNNLGRMLMRPGTNAAASTVADLALRAGSAGERLLTKSGYVFAEKTLFEFPIQNGVTLAANEAVAISASTSGRITKANASASDAYNTIGICVIGGTGNAGGTVYALVALSGAVLSGFSGLTANSPVYLSTSTAGLVTSTPPTDATKFFVQLGYALTSSAVIVQIMPVAPAPLAVRDVSSSTTLTETDEVLVIDTTGGAVDITGTAVTTNRARAWAIKMVPGPTNKISFVCAGSEQIENGGAGVGIDFPDSTSGLGPSYTLLRVVSGDYFIL